MQEIRVLVCDDEELIHQKVEELIKTYVKQMNMCLRFSLL